MERVCIFIDGSNLYHGLKANYGNTRIDFKKLGDVLREGRQLLRIYYYNVPLDAREEPEEYKRQQQFFDRLNKTDYLELRFGRLVKRTVKNKWCQSCARERGVKLVCQECGSQITGEFRTEKGVDVKLAVDMLSLAATNTYNTAILVSGDGDLKDAVQAFFPRGTAHALRNAVDRAIILDQAKVDMCRP
jgi:uncharacterized LabA/DUF88 family protein